MKWQEILIIGAVKLLLTHGYFLYEDPKEQAIMRPYPPLGMLYVSAWLEQHDYPNEVFDSTFSSFDQLKAYLLEHQPQYIGVYTNLMTRIRVMELVSFIRATDALKNTVVILGGPEVKNNASDFLQHGVDFLIVGEGESTMLELVQALDQNDQEAAKEVPGTVHWAEGKAIFAPERTKLKHLDELPMPARDKIDLWEYLNVWKEYHGSNAISVNTMRGCPYTCKWCSRAVYGLSYRRRSPQHVADELEHLQNTYQPDSLWFVDDVFTVSHKWLKEFNEELKRRQLKIPYECITRADRMNEEVIDLLIESGCFRVWIGAESGSQKVVDLMDRRVEVGKVRSMIQQAKAKGIEAGTFIMLGYPGETEEDIDETIHHLKVSNPDHFTITVAYPIKGTELFAEIEGLQTHEIDFLSQTDRDREFERTYNRRYYDYAVRRVVNEVNYNKQRLAGKLFSPRAVNLKMRSTAAFMGMWWQRTIVGNS